MSILEGLPEHVRIATPGDREQLLAFVKEGFGESGLMGISWRKVAIEIDSLLARKTGFILVVDGDGEIAASLALTVEAWWYSDEFVIGERWLFVRPKYRRSRYALDLIETGHGISDRWDCAYLMGIISTVRLEAKSRLYRRKMTMVGAVFMHGIERCGGPLGLLAEDGNSGQRSLAKHLDVEFPAAAVAAE